MYCSHIGAELSYLSLPCLHVLFTGRQAGGRAFIEELKFLGKPDCLIPVPPPHRSVAACYRRGGCGAFIEGSNLLCMELFFLFLSCVGCRALARPLCATGAFIEGSTFRLVVTDF